MNDAKEKSLWSIFTAGLIRENPVLRLVLGCCATLAVTTEAVNGLGMGAATTFVLVCSNLVISLLRNIIPNKVRIPCFIVVIAGFVTIVQMLVKAFVPALDSALGIFLPLIVVNCIILGRAEAFAGKNSVLASAADGLGMGVGFTTALFCMGFIREFLGTGTITISLLNNGNALFPAVFGENPITVFILAPGGFFVFGMLIALANHIAQKKGKKAAQLHSCKACPMFATCTSGEKEAEEQ